MESIFYEPTKIFWQAEEQGSQDALLAPVRKRGAGGSSGLMEGKENQGREGHEGAKRAGGGGGSKVSLLVNDLSIVSLSEKSTSDLRREKVNPDDRI